MLLQSDKAVLTILGLTIVNILLQSDKAVLTILGLTYTLCSQRNKLSTLATLFNSLRFSCTYVFSPQV